MYKKLYALIVLYASLSITAAEFRPKNPMFYSGSIHVQSPSVLSILPEMRIYCGGSIVDCESDNASKRISFSICEERSQTQFYLVVANPDDIGMETDENTIKYFKIKQGKNYKFYMLTLKEHAPDSTSDRHARTSYSWQIRETKIPFPNGRLPEMAIIVCYDPAFVKSIHGGDAVRLPEITLHVDAPEDTVHALSRKMLLSCLDYDLFHARSQRRIKHDSSNKAVLTLIT